MANPVPLNAESFNVGAMGFSLWNVSPQDKYFPAPPAEGENATGQFGRGTGATQGWAIIGDPGAGFTFPLGPTANNPSAPAVSNTCGQFLAFCQNGNFGSSGILTFWDTNNPNTAALPLVLYTNASSQIVAGWASAISGAGTSAIYATSTNALPPGTGGSFYSVIEVCFKTHASTGFIHVMVDGVDWINVSGINTSNGGTGVIAGAAFGGFNVCSGGPIPTFVSGEDRQYTDWIVHDGSGFYGDVRVGYFPANATGTFSAGTPVGGTAVQCVDDVHGEDEGADYIDFDDSSLPKAATFHVQALPSNVIAVLAVIPRVVARKTDAGTNQGRELFISGGTTTDGGADFVVPSNWRIYERVYVNDPNTSAPWTISNANAVEVGFRRTV